jgi:hypothetical protein
MKDERDSRGASPLLLLVASRVDPMKLYVIVVAVLIATAGMAYSAEPEYGNLRFNADERQFLQLLAEQDKAFNHLVILFGVAEITDAPKTPKELSETLAKEAVSVRAPSWAAAIRGAKQIVVSAAIRDIQLFVEGKHPDLKDKKPQATNRQFFLDLAKSYEKLRE